MMVLIMIMILVLRSVSAIAIEKRPFQIFHLRQSSSAVLRQALAKILSGRKKNVYYTLSNETNSRKRSKIKNNHTVMTVVFWTAMQEQARSHIFVWMEVVHNGVQGQWTFLQ